MLGYNQVTWDNDSGRERQPWSSEKSWAALSNNEKKATVLLGYSQKSWDNESGNEPQPASEDKSWAELTLCTPGEDPSQILRPIGVSLCLLLLGISNDSHFVRKSGSL